MNSLNKTNKQTDMVHTNNYAQVLRRNVVAVAAAVGLVAGIAGCSSNNGNEALNNGVFSNYGQLSQTQNGVVKGMYPVSVSQTQGGTQTVVGANSSGVANIIGSMPITGGNNYGFFSPVASAIGGIGGALFGSAVNSQYHPDVRKGVEVLVRFNGAATTQTGYNAQTGSVNGQTIGILQTPKQAKQISVGEHVVVVQNKQTGACTIFPEQ